MHRLARIGHPRYAQAFVDYLKSLGIEASMEMSSQGAEVFIHSPDAMARAEQELDLFQQDPRHERYLAASWQLGDEVDEAKNQQFSGFYEGESALTILRKTGWLTRIVVLICAAVFMFTHQGMDAEAVTHFSFFANKLEIWSSFEAWRWITPAFLHFGWLHFGFNMSAWWVFAGLIERTQGRLRLFNIFLFTGVISNWIQFIWSGDNFGGLSGVVYGVFGYLWFFQRFAEKPPFQLPKGLVVMMVLAMMFGFTGLMNIANQAHLSGLLCGCLLGVLFARLDKKTAI